MPLKDRKYKQNQSILKIVGYGDSKKIELVTMRWLRTSGIEDEDVFSARGLTNNAKLEESIIRSRRTIFELAYCNPWDWFFTGTLDPRKYNRTDLTKFHKDLTQWIRDYRKKTGQAIRFLLIPELHKDGRSWHMHGFLYGLPADYLHQFVIGDIMGDGIRNKVVNGDIVYNWPDYQKKFGFCDLEPIKNQEACSKYVTKYISKNLYNSVKDLNAHLFYHSRGLKKAEIIEKGTMLADMIPFPYTTYENEYCTKYTILYSEEALNYLRDLF